MGLGKKSLIEEMRAGRLTGIIYDLPSGEFVTPLIFRMAGVSLDPHPFNLVLL